MPDGPYPIKRAGVEGEVTGGRSLGRPRRADDDGPSADDLEKFGGVTRPCPSCGKDVYDDATRCYHCGDQIERHGASTLPKVWVIVVVLILVALMLGVLIR